MTPISALAIVCAMIAAISLSPRAAETAFPGANGRIVYSLRIDTNDFDLWSINPDGTDAQQLVTGPQREYNPAVSPDGTRIAFSSSRDTGGGSEELYLVDLDGSNLVRLTNNNSYDFFPTWSPDGQSLAFVSDRDGDEEIFVMPAVQGGAAVQLTDNDIQDAEPAWSPNGAKIAFMRYLNGGEIWTMDADGDNQTLVPNGGPNSEDPDWSPDGSMIAFRSYRDGPDQIYTMTSTGQNVTNILPGSGDSSPKWSPAGDKIAFIHNGGNGDQVWMMDSDGTNLEAVTTATEEAYDPSWAPLIIPDTPSPTPTPSPSPSPTDSPTATATPGPTASPAPSETPEPTPTPTSIPSPQGQTVVWADDNCSGASDPVDSLLTLRHDAGLGTVTGDCPSLGTQVQVLDGLPASVNTYEWGDIDCSEAIDPIDSLKILRSDAGLSVSIPLACPIIGSEVQILYE